MHPHPFSTAPNRTLLTLAVPVLFSLVAEPLTGIADTIFVARVGSGALAALGIGTMAFSSVFWMFSFLGVGTQTEVAKALGRDDTQGAARMVGLAIALAACVGIVLWGLSFPFLGHIAGLLGGEGVVRDLAVEYMNYRFLGAPAVLVTLACFGGLRGVQDMKTPLYAAVLVNALNVLLDWLLVFGVGPFPEMGVRGAALASSLSQWVGAGFVLVVTADKIGVSRKVDLSKLGRLLTIGGDLFIRTGAVLVFISLCTRVANKAGMHEGAAFQAIRQFFIFAALFLDAFAVTAQSLVGYFLAGEDVETARRVAKITCIWSFATGCLLCLVMLAGTDFFAYLLVPAGALSAFLPGWKAMALLQPISSFSYATDGIHWGTGDFAFLRNAMLVACGVGVPLAWTLEGQSGADILVWVVLVMSVWTTIRAGFGLVRIWPGIGLAPLRARSK